MSEDVSTFPMAALNAAIEGARVANPVIEGPNGAKFVLKPRDFTMEKLPNPGELAPWPTQHVTVDDRASLAAYANRFKDARSILIADYDASGITAHLDWHGDNQSRPGEVGPVRHSVTLKLRFSEEFSRWNAIAGKLQEQADFARFLEENAADVRDPEAAQMIEISRDFEATVGQTYRAATRLDNGDRRLRFESESKAMNEVVIPQRFTLEIPVYNGEAPDALIALFRWRGQPSGGVMLGFEWHRLEYMRRAHFQQIAVTAAEETGLPVFIGRIG